MNFAKGLPTKMSRTLRTLTAVGAVAALTAGLAACSGGEGDQASGEQTLVVATSGSPKPFTYKDDSDELTGYDIEILKLIDEALDDVTLDYQVTDFPAMFAGLDSGRYNLVANNLSTSEERKEKYDFATPHTHHIFGVAVPEDSDITEFSSFEEFAGLTAYGEPGLNFTQILETYNEENANKAIEIDYTEADIASQYRALAAGQVDFMFNDKVVYDKVTEDSDLPLKFIPVPDEYLADFGTSLYSAFAFSKQTPNVDHIVEEFNAEIEKLGEDGTLQKLSEEYVGTDISSYRGKEDTTE